MTSECYNMISPISSWLRETAIAVSTEYLHRTQDSLPFKKTNQNPQTSKTAHHVINLISNSYNDLDPTQLFT